MISAYELHEWGTFTTVSGSDGGLLSGVEVEEEHLPDFVYSHIGMRNLQSPYYLGQAQFKPPTSIYLENQHQVGVSLLGGDSAQVLHPNSNSMKGMEKSLLRNVTVKMETPVIYIYGDDAPKLHVKVGFHGGTISQWYPARKAGDTPNVVARDQYALSPHLEKMLGNREMVLMREPINFGDKAKPYQGSIEWDVEVLPKSAADAALTFKPDENSTWIYPRVPSANVLKVGKEHEDFLFYRGLGHFDLPATFSVDSAETVVITNRSKEAIPFAFAFENIGGVFRYKTIGAIAPDAMAKIAESQWTQPVDAEGQKVEVFQQMREGLMRQGLNADEANGMIKTWWKSYFDKPGLRVFWVVPQTDLEKILPLQVNPAPAKKVRVLVGRADVMRPKLEREMIAQLGTKSYVQFHMDRFFPCYTERLKQLVREPVYQKFDTENLKDTYLMIHAKNDSASQHEHLYLQADREIRVNNLNLSGKWEVIGEDQLKIGETVFQLDKKTGLLAAKNPADSKFKILEIQLPKAL